MNITGNSVGIDYHFANLQVTVMSPEGAVLINRKCQNKVQEVDRIVSAYGAVKSVAIEACTGSASFADELRSQTGWDIKLCHPGYVNRMRHNPDKSDKTDGYLLSDLNRVGYLPQVWLAPEGLRDLRVLIRYRKQLVDERKKVRQWVQGLLKMHRVNRPENIKVLWTQKGMRWLNNLKDFGAHTQWVFESYLKEHEHRCQLIKKADVQILKVYEQDSIMQYLDSLPGVGVVGAAVLRTEIGDFSRFRNGKQLSRYVGVSPKNCSSGERQADAGLIKAGNPLLKTVVIEIVHVLLRCDSHWKAFAHKLRAEGKAYCVVVGAVANRWLRKLYYQMREVERSINQCIN